MGETAETLRTGVDYTKLRCSRATPAKYHHASKKPGERSPFDPESYLKLPPNYDAETEAIETALYAVRALENCLRSNTKDRRRAPEPVSLHQSTRTPCRVLSPEVRLQGRLPIFLTQP